MQEIQEGHTLSSSQDPFSKDPCSVQIGAGLRSMPFKLAEKIHSLECVNLTKLLLNQLGTSGDNKLQNPKQNVISSILN